MSGQEMAAGPESSVEEPVLVATHRIDPEILAHVQDACEKAHARYVSWSGEVGLRGLRKTPTVIVTGLRVGERRIPDDVLDLATSSYPDLAILVLCREPLLRPTMSLDNGRVTLVSPPLTPSRVASALRGLLTDRHAGYASTDTATGHLAPKSSVSVRRYRRSDYEVVAMAGAPPDGGTPRLPIVRQTKIEGLTILLPSPGTVREFRINDIAAGFKRDRDGGDRGSALEGAIGNDGAALHLAPGADEWTLYWPHKQWPLLLSSPLRLPNVWNIANSMEQLGKNLLRLQTAHCDMIAALSSYPVPTTEPGGSRATLMPFLEAGPAAFVDFVERSVGEHPVDFVGVVVEVF